MIMTMIWYRITKLRCGKSMASQKGHENEKKKKGGNFG